MKTAREASAAEPSNVALYRQLVDVMVRAEGYRDVLADLDRIQKSNPNVYWTYMMRGLVLHRLKRDAEATPEWDRALDIVMALRDDSPTGEVVEKFAGEYGAEATGKWLEGKMGQDVRMRALMLSLYANDRKFEKVIGLGEQILPELATLNARAQSLILNNLGNAYLLSNPSNPVKACEIFDVLVKIEPENVMALNNLAYALLLQGSPESIARATTIAQKANEISTKSGSPNAYVADTYGWALIQSGKVQEGIDVLREAGAIQQIPEVPYHLGEAYILEKQKDAALQSLQNALALIQKLSQNGAAPDVDLETRVKDAITRAQAMSDQ